MSDGPLPEGEAARVLVRGRVAYVERFVEPDEAAALYEALLAETRWSQDHVRIFGRTIPMPRLVAWYGEPGAVYRYSGTVNVPHPFTPRLHALRDRLRSDPRVVALAGPSVDERWNSVLLNLYRDGRDSVGLHADDEPELGPAPVIASLSLGATRRFVMKPRKPKGGDVSIELAPGSVLLMFGDCQRAYRHALPKTAREVGPRINLTFRRVIAPAT